jgi:hypothetical protein
MSPVALPAEAETASTPDTETTPAASGGNVDPTTAYAIRWAGEARTPKTVPAATVSQGIPFMVTKAMKVELRARGISDEQITNMTSQQAWETLATPGTPARGPEPPVSSVEPAPPPPVALPAEPLVVEESASVSERSAPNDKLEALGRLDAAPEGTSEDAAVRHPGDRPVEINRAGAKAYVDRIVARYGRPLPRKKDGDPNLARAVGLMERFFKKNEPSRDDETEPCRPFDTEGRADQEHPEAIVRATPVKTRPLFDLEKLRIYLEKLRASFKFGPSQGEPTAIVSPVRYAQSVLRRIEQLAREMKEIASRAGTTNNVFELFTSWKSDKANRTADASADIATLSQKPATEDKTQNTPIDCTVDAAAEIATLKQKLTAAEARIQWKAKSTPTLDDLRERMAVLLRDPPTLDAAARTPLATAQVTHGRATESGNAAPEWPQLVAAFIARELGFVGMA